MAWLYGFLACLVLAACAGPAPNPGPGFPGAESEQIAAGNQIANGRCASCHSVGKAGISPLALAPPLRNISARYRLDVLREELQQGLHVGAVDMPKFSFTLAEIDALTAYLASIQVKVDGQPASIK